MARHGVSFSSSNSSNASITHTINNCIFDSNYFNDEDPSIGFSEGLDISVSVTTHVIVEYSRFLRNNASLNWAYGPLLLKAGNISVRYCIFADNIARLGPLTILNTDDSLPPLTVDVNNCTFQNNLGLESASVYSRKIRKTNSITLSNLTIQYNRAHLNVIVLSEGPQTLQSSVISLNNGSSGALRVESKNTGSGKISVLNCVVERNLAEAVVGGIDCEDVALDITGTIVRNNYVQNSSATSVQIVCNNCANCGASTPPPAVNVGLLLGILIPSLVVIFIVIGVCWIKNKRADGEYTSIQN